MGIPDGTDRRLRRELPLLRRHVATTSVLSAALAAATIAQASLLAAALAGDGEPTGPLLGFAAAVAARATLGRARTALAARAASAAKAELRDRLLGHTTRLGPLRLARRRAGEAATLVTAGLDALDPYITGYLPKRAAAAVVPLAVLGWLALTDWASALIIAVTLPLVPVFGVLVGTHTRSRTARQWSLLARLGGHFLDAVAGLPTLRAFGRAGLQAATVARMADDHRRATVRTLRVAFLSSLVMELVASLAIALVAVPIGLRLLAGTTEMHTALVVLFLTPEAFLPLRAAGAAFHDSAPGLAAARQAFEVLDEPAAPVPVPAASGGGLRLDGVTVRYPGLASPALVDVSLRVAPGERVALVGPSGAGKSTVLAALLGFTGPESGRVRAGGPIAWVPQRPHLFAASVADNIRLGHPGATADEVRAAAAAAFADGFVSALPDGYDTVLGEGGAGLSAGQRQRIALARAFLREAPVLLLDEPTAHLDADSEAAVLEASTRLMAGRTVLVVAHRPALLRHVDRVIHLQDGRVRPAALVGSA
jgi:thiol reductant ABC exporter CydD subunit